MIRVAICDDEPDAISIVKFFLKHEGLPVELVGEAYNGVDAVSLIKKKKPHLVFMDIHMPFLNGLEVMEKFPDVKFILITAYGSFEYAQAALRLHACDILSKPIDFDQMRAAIDKAIGGKYTGNDIVDTILEYIQENYSEKIELEQLAELTHCSDVHVSRVFKKEMGMTVMGYINKLRIEKAEILLKEGESIKETAERVGYQNTNVFYKYFKQYTGITPAVYLSKNKE